MDGADAKYMHTYCKYVCLEFVTWQAQFLLKRRFLGQCAALQDFTGNRNDDILYVEIQTIFGTVCTVQRRKDFTGNGKIL